MGITDSSLSERLLVTVDDAARMLSVSSRSVWLYIARGLIQPTRLGRAVRLRREDVERLAREGVQK